MDKDSLEVFTHTNHRKHQGKHRVRKIMQGYNQKQTSKQKRVSKNGVDNDHLTHKLIRHVTYAGSGAYWTSEKDYLPAYTGKLEKSA